MSKLREWWFSLEKRYKVLLICGASGLLLVILVVVLFFVFKGDSITGTPREITVKKFYKAWQSGDTESAAKYLYNEGASEQWELWSGGPSKDWKIQTLGEKPFEGYMVEWPGPNVKRLGLEKNIITQDKGDMDKMLAELKINEEPVKINGYEVKTRIYTDYQGMEIGDIVYFDLIYDGGSWKIVRSDLSAELNWSRD